MNHFAVLTYFLRDREHFLADISQDKHTEATSLSLLICSSLFFAIYGAIMGSFSGGLQILSAATKLPALYLLTLLICLPALYFFDVVAGSRRNFLQYLALMLAAMAAMSVILFGFAPIALFFRLSLGDYQFFKLLNVAILSFAGLVGVRLFHRGIVVIRQGNGQQRQRDRLVLRAWLVLYAFVGSQLGWTLRPFFGAPDKPFELFRDLESNFYWHLIQTIFGAFIR